VSDELEQGQRIDLTKEFPNLTNVKIGIGWNDTVAGTSVVIEETKGLLGALKQRASTITKKKLDVDVSCFLLNDQEKFLDVIYFNKKLDAVNGIKLSDDNAKGHSAVDDMGDLDDEIIFVDLSQVKPHIFKLDFWVTIHESQKSKLHFGVIQNAYIRLINRVGGAEMCKYNLSGAEYEGSTAIKFGSLYRHNDSWKFYAEGEGTFDASLNSIKTRYV
jgi:stress response protein SCP2